MQRNNRGFRCICIKNMKSLVFVFQHLCFYSTKLIRNEENLVVKNQLKMVIFIDKHAL